MGKINLKEFIDEDGVVCIENILLENEVFDGLNVRWLTIKDCTFKNIVFKNYNGELNIEHENCSFCDCIFENITSKEFFINSQRNYYFNCKFKKIYIEDFIEQSSIYREKFENCTFEDMHIWADISSNCLSIEKSILNNFNCFIHDNDSWKIIDSKIKNTKLKGTIVDNYFQNVEFDEFKITCGKEDIDTNTFIDCEKEKIDIKLFD